MRDYFNLYLMIRLTDIRNFYICRIKTSHIKPYFSAHILLPLSENIYIYLTI